MATYQDGKAIQDFFREKLKDKIEVTQWGATITPKGKKLSPGCYCCKSGSWICVYIGVSCNLKCISCPQTSRHDQPEFIWANGGNDDINSIEALKRVMDKNPRINGISFSGGEPFLYLNKVYEWLDFINENYADKNLYLWIYTNGMKVTKDACLKLKSKGIKEIRFDFSATNYSDKILQKIKYCRDIFEKICVEVPVEPWKTEKLLQVLPKLDEIGLDYLNLHELSTCDDNRGRLLDNKLIDPKLIYYGPSGEHYLPSIFDAYRIIEFIINNNLNIIYNDCSARNMVLQQLGWQYQRNRQNPNYVWEDWEDFLVRAEKDGNIP